MRIKPNQENITRKEQNCPKRDKKCQEKNNKIYRKINLELGFLTDQTVKHGFVWSVDEVFFTVVKIVDDIAEAIVKADKRTIRKRFLSSKISKVLFPAQE